MDARLQLSAMLAVKKIARRSTHTTHEVGVTRTAQLTEAGVPEALLLLLTTAPKLAEQGQGLTLQATANKLLARAFPNIVRPRPARARRVRRVRRARHLYRRG